MSKKYELFKENETDTSFRIRALRDFSDVKMGDIGGYVETESNLSHEGDCWIYDEAKVFGYARVYGYAKVYGEAIVFDEARVYGKAMVYGKSWIYGNSRVFGEARVFDGARIFDKARIFDNAEVSGHTYIFGRARVFNNAEVYNYAEVFGNVEVFGKARVFDNAEVYGKARVFGNAKVYGKARLSKSKIDSKVITFNPSRDYITIDGKYIHIGCECRTIKQWLKDYKKIGKKYDYTESEIEEYRNALKFINDCYFENHKETNQYD